MSGEFHWDLRHLQIRDTLILTWGKTIRFCYNMHFPQTPARVYSGLVFYGLNNHTQYEQIKLLLYSLVKVKTLVWTCVERFLPVTHTAKMQCWFPWVSWHIFARVPYIISQTGHPNKLKKKGKINWSFIMLLPWDSMIDSFYNLIGIWNSIDLIL